MPFVLWDNVLCKYVSSTWPQGGSGGFEVCLLSRGDNVLCKYVSSTWPPGGSGGFEVCLLSCGTMCCANM